MAASGTGRAALYGPSPRQQPLRSSSLSSGSASSGLRPRLASMTPSGSWTHASRPSTSGGLRFSSSLVDRSVSSTPMITGSGGSGGKRHHPPSGSRRSPGTPSMGDLAGTAVLQDFMRSPADQTDLMKDQVAEWMRYAPTPALRNAMARPGRATRQPRVYRGAWLGKVSTSCLGFSRPPEAHTLSPRSLRRRRAMRHASRLRIRRSVNGCMLPELPFHA